jgi:DNA/RNA-binding domain of Phe-tRNA-synthetase-like protein
MLTVSKAWKETYPGAMIGILAMEGIEGFADSLEPDARKTELERALVARFAGKTREDILALPVIQSYRKYYKRFKKTYHVQLQLESVALKGKPINTMPGLVEATFLAELETLLLTAVHDSDKIEGPLNLEIAEGDEIYTLMRGEDHSCAQGDMIMQDARGVICSVIYGSDRRTMVTGSTSNALFATYVPPGFEDNVVEEHLNILEENVKSIAPESMVRFREIYHT